MSYAMKTTEASAYIRACVDFGKTLKETIEYVMRKYDGLTEEYITEKYEMYSSK